MNTGSSLLAQANESVRTLHPATAALWAIVFPLGMYGVAGQSLGGLHQVPIVAGIGRYEEWDRIGSVGCGDAGDAEAPVADRVVQAVAVACQA